MAARTGLTVVKRFPYRGSTTEEFSNTYHFDGTVPSDASAWRTLFDALVLQEKTVYPSQVQVIRGYGYATDDPLDNSVWSVDLTVSPNSPVAGTCSTSGAQRAPGDAAVWVRWKTSRLNSVGKAIYLRKYFHPAIVEAAGSDPDLVWSTQQTAMTAFGTKMMDGSFAGGKITAQEHTDTIISAGHSNYITTRTLKRRGKRPGS